MAYWELNEIRSFGRMSCPGLGQHLMAYVTGVGSPRLFLPLKTSDYYDLREMRSTDPSLIYFMSKLHPTMLAKTSNLALVEGLFANADQELDESSPIVEKPFAASDESCHSLTHPSDTKDSSVKNLQTSLRLLEALGIGRDDDREVNKYSIAPTLDSLNFLIDKDIQNVHVEALTSQKNAPHNEDEGLANPYISRCENKGTLLAEVAGGYQASDDWQCSVAEREAIRDEGYYSVQGDFEAAVGHDGRSCDTGEDGGISIAKYLQQSGAKIPGGRDMTKASSSRAKLQNKEEDSRQTKFRQAAIERDSKADDSQLENKQERASSKECSVRELDELEWVIQSVGDNKWLLGPSMLLKRYPVATEFCTWTDRDGSGYTLRQLKRGEKGFLLPPKYANVTPRPYPFIVDGPVKMVKSEARHGVWRIGGWGYFKSVPWTKRMGTEDETIAYLQEAAPNIPIPDVYSCHYDRTLGRSYLLMSRMEGTRLNEAWFGMTSSQKTDVVWQVADIVVQLSNLNSNLMVSAAKKSISEPFLRKTMTDKYNPWRTLIDRTEYRMYENIWGKGKQNEFVFQHGDLSPTNIKLKLDNKRWIVSGLFDWEVAGFLPRGWIATKMMVSGGMDLVWDHPGWVIEQTEWRRALARKLGSFGFKSYGKEWSKWVGHKFVVQDNLTYIFSDVGREDEVFYW